MKPDLFSISVPDACKAHWESMPVSSDGRYCDNCQHTVTDFTGYSQQELADFFGQEKNAGVCGRFYAHQLQDKEFSYHPPLQWPHKSWLLAASVAALTVMSVGAQAQAPRAASHVFPTVKRTAAPEQQTHKTDSLIIRGEVRNTRGEEVINASLVLYQGTEQVAGAISDFDGNYELGIPRQLLSGQPLRLECHYLLNHTEQPLDVPQAQNVLVNNIRIEIKRLNTEQTNIVVGRPHIKKKKRR